MPWTVWCAALRSPLISFGAQTRTRRRKPRRTGTAPVFAATVRCGTMVG